MTTGTDIAQLYIEWLWGTLKSAYVNGDYLGLGDPEMDGSPEYAARVGKTYGWTMNEPSQAHALYTNLKAQMSDAGFTEAHLAGMPGFSVPIWNSKDVAIPTFMDTYGQLQKTFGGEAASPASPVSGMEDFLGNKQLYKDAQGNFYNIDGNPINSAAAVKLISDFFDSGEAESMTPYQEQQMELALAQLAQEQYEFGNLSAAQKADLEIAQQQLELSKQELGLTERQYLSDIMANPANWIEASYASKMAGGTGMEGWPTKWYAETLSPGDTMPTWGAPGMPATPGISGGIPGATGGVPGGIGSVPGGGLDYGLGDRARSGDPEAIEEILEAIDNMTADARATGGSLAERAANIAAVNKAVSEATGIYIPTTTHMTSAESKMWAASQPPDSQYYQPLDNETLAYALGVQASEYDPNIDAFQQAQALGYIGPDQTERYFNYFTGHNDSYATPQGVVVNNPGSMSIPEGFPGAGYAQATNPATGQSLSTGSWGSAPQNQWTPQAEPYQAYNPEYMLQPEDPGYAAAYQSIPTQEEAPPGMWYSGNQLYDEWGQPVY